MLKKIKRRLFSRKNGGFTLVEVIVSSALLGILLVGIVAFITPAFKLMKTEETNAQASTIATAMENYITRSLRSTPYVKIFTNATLSDFAATSANMSSGDMKELLDWAAAAENAEIYEIRCIGIRKATDPRSNETKYMLYQSYVKDGQLTSTYEYPVFEGCFYNGLYPTLSIKQATNQYRDLDDDGNPVFPKNEDGTMQTLTNRPALELELNIYDDSQMNTSSLVYTGYGLTELYMISSNKFDPAPEKNQNSYGYKIYPTTQVRDDSAAETANAQDTFIFYAARKLTESTSTPTS